MGCSDSLIMDPDCEIIAGGDDVVQSFPETFDLPRYVEVAKTLGFELEMKEHKNFHGVEFFSTLFKLDNGIWKYYPVRFSKHIAKLRTTKYEDLPMALSSHMINYCWDTKRFMFFQKMFTDLRRENPSLFPLNLSHNMELLRYKSKGYEAGF